METTRPSIFDFTDYRLYLKSLFEHNKVLGNYSYSIFAERAGFQARSYLRTVISGKRNLTANAIEKVIIGFNLTLKEADAFRALVRFNQCQKFDEKSYYWEQFLKLRSGKSRSVIIDEYLYLARMAYPILLVILKQSHISKNMNELIRLTGLTKTELEEGLRTFENLGIVVKTADGEYAAVQNDFKTHDDLPNIAVQRYHFNILEKAKQSLNLPPDKREFQSLMMALSEEEFLFLKKKIKNFTDEIENLFSGDRPKSTKVYSINLNLIPISPEFIREKNNSIASQKSGRDNTKMPLALEENQS